MKKFPQLLIGFIIFSVLASLSSHAEDEKLSVRFCRLKAPLAIHAYVAESKQLFDKHHLTVKFIPVQQAKICLDEMRAGRADAFIAAESVLNFQDPHDANFSVVARLARGPFTSVITKDISTVEGLRGKNIGVLPGTASQLLILTLLRDHHISFRDVTFVPIQPPGWSSALAGGTIEAASAFEPFASVALKTLEDKGHRLEGRYESDGLLVLSKDFIKNHREKAASILASLIESENVINTSFAESREIVALETGDRMEHIAKHRNAFSFHVTLDNSSLMLMKENAKLLSQLNSTDSNDMESYSYRELFDASILKELDPLRTVNFE